MMPQKHDAICWCSIASQPRPEIPTEGKSRFSISEHPRAKCAQKTMEAVRMFVNFALPSQRGKVFTNLRMIHIHMYIRLQGGKPGRTI